LKQRKRKAAGKAQIIIYLYVLLVLLSLFSVASYTWFSLSRTPRVSDMYLFINSDTGLELSIDPLAEEWELQLDFRDIIKEETKPLRPITWVETRDQFYAAMYGMDGRLMPYSYWVPLTDERNANKNTIEGYYLKVTFYARSGINETVHLSEAVEVDEGINGSGTYVIGVPNWDNVAIAHSNGGQGAECAVRLGFKITWVDLQGKPIGERPIFYIYEPNSDAHIDGSSGYVPTPSIDQAATLVPDSRLILQTKSSWSEAYPVQREAVVHDLGEFTTDTELFKIRQGEMVKIDVYCWLEGQDVDCTNEIEAAQILASIQFVTEPDEQSGLKPIE